jgi:hypothetical protein
VSLYAIALSALTVIFGQQSVPVVQMDRYSHALERVVESEPLPFKGAHAKERSLVLLADLAWHESGLREEVEYCRFRPHAGMTEDHGRSKGVTQLYEGASWAGHSREEICGDVELQFRLALRYLTAQVKRCGDVERGIGSYNSNSCMVTTYAARISHSYRRVAAKVGI